MNNTLMRIPLVIMNIVMRGLTFKYLWGWFVVSQFDMAHSLSIPASIGMANLISFAALGAKIYSPKEWESLKEDVEQSKVDYEDKVSSAKENKVTLNSYSSMGIINDSIGIAGSLSALLAGWIIHVMM